MQPDPRIRLNEVVSVDTEHGLSSTDLLDWWPSILDYCCLMNDQAWTTINFQGEVYRYVKEFPNEVKDRLLEAYEKTTEYYPNQNSHPSHFYLFTDNEKTVMINMEHVKAIRSIDDTTKFTFKRGTLTLNLPLHMLDVPQDKIKPTLRRGRHGK